MLSPGHRQFAYWVLAIVFASGSLHFLLHQFFQTAGSFGFEPQPAEPWVLRIHGAAAMATLMLLGSMLPIHVSRWWRAGRNRLAGAALLGAGGVLIVSGYGLYYVGSDGLRLWARWLHIIVGGAALPIFLTHLWRGRPSVDRRPSIRRSYRPQPPARRWERFRNRR